MPFESEILLMKASLIPIMFPVVETLYAFLETRYCEPLTYQDDNPNAYMFVHIWIKYDDGVIKSSISQQSALSVRI